MTDFISPCAGTTVTLSYVSNTEIELSSDQSWVTFVKDDQNHLVDIVVAEYTGFGIRKANVSFTSGSNLNITFDGLTLTRN